MSLESNPPSSEAPTLESLSDDCLLCIVDELKTMRTRDEIGFWRKLDLASFSAVNKRIQQLSIPFMFKSEHLFIRMDNNERDLVDRLKGLEQFFAHSKVLALSVLHCGDQVEVGKSTKFDSTAALGRQIVTTLPSLSGLKNLRLRDVKILDSASKAALRQMSLDLVGSLSVTGVPDAACFIRVCPNLTSFKSDFPCNKPKTTLKALSESPVNTLELQNGGWKPKQIEDLCQYLGKIHGLYLGGQIKVKATELVTCLQPLQNLREFTIQTEPWIDRRTLNTNSFFFDPFEDALDALAEDIADVARATFDALPSLAIARIIDEFVGPEEWTAVRDTEGSIKSIRSEELDYDSLAAIFPAF